MRKAFFLILAVVACSKGETPAADSVATAAPPAAPAALTAADVRGTWTGTFRREGDTTATAFTVISVSDSTGKFIAANSKDTVNTMTRFDGDSMIVTSAPYKDPSAPKGPDVTFRSVGRLKDGKLVGTATTSPAAKPDTVVGRSTWEASRAP